MGTTSPAGFPGIIPINTGGSGQTSAQAAFDALAPTATKGDIIVYGSAPAALGVGSNTQVLTASSGQTNGVYWNTAPNGTATSVGISSTTLIVTNTPITVSGNINVAAPLSVTGSNMLINGDFQVWQRGAGGSAAIAVAASTTLYTADRWQLLTGTNQACTVTQTAGANSGMWTVLVQRNSGQTGTGVLRFAQTVLIDGCVGAAGNVITISFQGKYGANYTSSANALTVTVYSGTGASDKSGINGAFTGTANAISQTATLTSSFTSFQYSSAALGSTITQLCVEFSYTPVGTASTTDGFYLQNVQLEIAPQSTNFQYRSMGWQLQACQAYYNKSFNYAIAPAQNAGTGNGEYHSYMRSTLGAGSESINWISFPSFMRAAPTTTLYNPSAANAQVRNIGTSADWSSCSIDQATPMGLSVIGTADSGSTAGNQVAYNWTADADVT